MIHNIGAVATLNDSENLLDPIIFHGKSMLSKMIFNIYGLKVVSGGGLDDYIHPELILKSDIDYLIKRNLVKDVDPEYKENYKNYFNNDLYKFNSSHREHVYSFVGTKELIEKISMESHGFEEGEDDFEMIVGFNNILAFNLYEPYKNRMIATSDGPAWFADIIEGSTRPAITTL